jgi:hypothetical protein
MHSKKEIKKRKKHMASFMTAKSTAKLKEEIDQVLAEDIPDPNMPPAFDFDAPPLPVDERVIDEGLVDMMDAEEKARKQDEDSRRY